MGNSGPICEFIVMVFKRREPFRVALGMAIVIMIVADWVGPAVAVESGVRQDEVSPAEDWQALRAAALSGLGVPGAALAVGFLGQATNMSGPASPVMQFVPVTPVFFGLGHWYAGDRERALVVGGGGIVCMYISSRIFTNDVSFDQTGTPMIGMDGRRVLFFLAYSVFASWDAYQTSRSVYSRRLRELSFAPQPNQ